MVVKFFGNKKGGSSKAIDYLLNEREAQGTAKVLQGDPTITREIINSIQFKQKVTVGCLSFEEKNIDQEQKYKLMKEFEETLLPGMQDRYNILWVEHTDKDRLELNFVIPKIDLKTQKSLNPYYHKADLPRVEKWQDIQNLEYGYSSPKDPSKKRTLETHSIKHINNDYEQLDKLLHNLVAEGTIKNREHLTELLKENGYKITRTGKDYISIKTPEAKRAKKFKGSIYNERFTSLEELRTISKERSQAIREYSKRDTSRELTRLKSELREYTHDKFTKLQEQFRRKEPKEHKRDRETTQKQPTNDRAEQQQRQKTNNISNSGIKPNHRDNRNDLHKTLSHTEREPRSINGDKQRTVQQSSESLQADESQGRETRERDRTATSNENSKQAINSRTERVASTTDNAERIRGREVYIHQGLNTDQRQRENGNLGTKRGTESNFNKHREVNNDSTRTTVNARTGTRETIKFRDYREIRKSRISIHKELTEHARKLRESTISNSRELRDEHKRDAKDIQERIRTVGKKQQDYNKQSSDNWKEVKQLERTVADIEPTISRYARFKQRVTSYISTAREYISNTYQDLKDRYSKNFIFKQEDLETSFATQDTKKDILGREMSFKDLERVQSQFDISATRDIQQEEQREQERQQQRSRSRGRSMSM